MSEPKIAIIGGGPAGLRAAEIAALSGAAVTLFDAKASVGRKFLVAGRGGLNITNAEAHESFLTRYSGPADRWAKMLAVFDADALRAWAAELGIETFAASTGRVYPREMKAAPLLRRWIQRLRGLGVELAMHHRWTGLRRDDGGHWQLEFDVQGQPKTVLADAVILALGGGSWPETGSDGSWPTLLTNLGVAVSPLVPANCGWEHPWPAEVLAAAEGQPLKNIVARAGETTVRGELLITKYGLEGGALYQLAPALRAMPAPTLIVDFKPDNSLEQLVAKMGPIRRNFLSESRPRWRLSEAAVAILSPRANEVKSPEEFALLVKHCPIELTGPRPIAEAISSAGGIRWDELDEGLMLRRLPGIFTAGEMIDWEAPTGGYLIQGCFATGQHAAQSALAWLQNPQTP